MDLSVLVDNYFRGYWAAVIEFEAIERALTNSHIALKHLESAQNFQKVSLGLAVGMPVGVAAATTTVGAVRAGVGVGYFARHPAKIARALRAGANALDDAGFVHDSIGVTSSGRPPIQYQHILRDTETHIRK